MLSIYLHALVTGRVIVCLAAASAAPLSVGRTLVTLLMAVVSFWTLISSTVLSDVIDLLTSALPVSASAVNGSAS